MTAFNRAHAPRQMRGGAFSVGSMGRGEDTATARVTPAQRAALHDGGSVGRVNPKTGLREYRQERRPGQRIQRGAMARAGRFGDTELVHVNPQEKAMLAARGGAGTVNPATGLEEFYIGSGYSGSPASSNAAGGGDTSAAEGHDRGYYGGFTGVDPETGEGVGDSAGGISGGSASDFQSNYGLSPEQAQQAAGQFNKKYGGMNPADAARFVGEIANDFKSSSAPAPKTMGNDTTVSAQVAKAEGLTPDQHTQAARNLRDSYADYRDFGGDNFGPTGNSFTDDVGNFFAGQLGFNERNPMNKSYGQLAGMQTDADGTGARADWGWDPAGLVGAGVGMATGVPLLGTAFDQVSKWLGRPAEINLGPDALSPTFPGADLDWDGASAARKNATVKSADGSGGGWFDGIGDAIGGAFDWGGAGGGEPGVVGNSGAQPGTGGQKGHNDAAKQMLDHITGHGHDTGGTTTPPATTPPATTPPATTPPTTTTPAPATTAAPVGGGAFIPFTGDYSTYGQDDPAAFQGEHIFFNNLPGNPQSNGSGPGSGGGSTGGGLPSTTGSPYGSPAGNAIGHQLGTGDFVGLPLPSSSDKHWGAIYNQFLANHDAAGYAAYLKGRGFLA